MKVGVNWDASMPPWSSRDNSKLFTATDVELKMFTGFKMLH